MKRLFFALTLLALGFGAVRAQEVANDRAKLYVGFTNATADYPANNVTGLNAAGQVKVVGYEGVKLEAVGDFAVLFVNGEQVYTYLAGPQVGLNLLRGRFNPYARIMFGVSRYDGFTSYGHSTGFGLDVNVTRRVFVRAFQYDKQNFNGADQPIYRIAGGVGIRL